MVSSRRWTGAELWALRDETLSRGFSFKTHSHQSKIRVSAVPVLPVAVDINTFIVPLSSSDAFKHPHARALWMDPGSRTPQPFHASLINDRDS